MKALDSEMKSGKNQNSLPFTVVKGNTLILERLESLNRSERSAVLATESDGQPYTSLVSFALCPDKRSLIFATPKSTSKYRNLLKNPRVSILIDNRSEKAGDIAGGEAITILGKARPVRRCKRWNELASALVAKNPELNDFVNAPTTGLIRVEATRYVHVGRFQVVTVTEAL